MYNTNPEFSVVLRKNRSAKQIIYEVLRFLFYWVNYLTEIFSWSRWSKRKLMEISDLDAQ